MWNIPIVSQPNQGPKHVHVYVPWNRRTSGFWFVKKSEIVRMINFFQLPIPSSSDHIREAPWTTLQKISQKIPVTRVSSMQFIVTFHSSWILDTLISIALAGVDIFQKFFFMWFWMSLRGPDKKFKLIWWKLERWIKIDILITSCKQSLTDMFQNIDEVPRHVPSKGCSEILEQTRSITQLRPYEVRIKAEREGEGYDPLAQVILLGNSNSVKPYYYRARLKGGPQVVSRLT